MELNKNCQYQIILPPSKNKQINTNKQNLQTNNLKKLLFSVPLHHLLCLMEVNQQPAEVPKAIRWA